MAEPIIHVYANPRRDLLGKVYALPPGIPGQMSRVTLRFRAETVFRLEGLCAINANADDWLVHSILIGNMENLAETDGQGHIKPVPLKYLRGDAWRSNGLILTFPTAERGKEIAITLSHILKHPADLELMLCGCYT